MGIHKISRAPKEIASLLKLSNIDTYTGHCCDISLKQDGGWKSNTAAGGYIEETLSNLKEYALKILSVNNDELLKENEMSKGVSN